MRRKNPVNFQRVISYWPNLLNEKFSNIERIKKKDADIILIQLDKEKKLAEILNLIDRKQNQIDELAKM